MIRVLISSNEVTIFSRLEGYFTSAHKLTIVSEETLDNHNVIMSVMVSQITSLTIVWSTVYSGAYQRKHQRSASLAFVGGINRWPVNSPHKEPVTRKMFPFDDVIMTHVKAVICQEIDPYHNEEAQQHCEHVERHTVLMYPSCDLAYCKSAHRKVTIPYLLNRWNTVTKIVH